MAGEASPASKTIEREVQPSAQAVDTNTDLAECPVTGTVTKVDYVPIAAITGANTNSRTVSLVNKGPAGSGSTVVATLAFTSGVNAAADVAKSVTLSGTAANLAVTSGDVLEWQSTHVGSGLADPGGLAHIEISRIAGS